MMSKKRDWNAKKGLEKGLVFIQSLLLIYLYLYIFLYKSE